MTQDNRAIEEFTNQFIENYTIEVIEDDVVSFYNDAFVMLQNFYDLEDEAAFIQSNYLKFIEHVLLSKDLLLEYTNFDFTTISTLNKLQTSTEFEQLKPIYTKYSFSEAEETVNQILEELKVVKEFQKELKDEINYLTEEYQFHLEHLEENMMYNFYVYEELTDKNLTEDELTDFQIEKRKFIQRITDKLSKK